MYVCTVWNNSHLAVLYERVLLLGNFEAQGLERFGCFVVIPKYTYIHYCNNYHLCMYVCVYVLPISSREVVIALLRHHVDHVIHRSALARPVRPGQHDKDSK